MLLWCAAAYLHHIKFVLLCRLASCHRLFQAIYWLLQIVFFKSQLSREFEVFLCLLPEFCFLHLHLLEASLLLWWHLFCKLWYQSDSCCICGWLILNTIKALFSKPCLRVVCLSLLLYPIKLLCGSLLFLHACKHLSTTLNMFICTSFCQRIFNLTQCNPF